MIEIVKTYTEHGLECLPCKLDKSPLLARGWKEKFSIDDFANAEAIGIKGGSYSGGLVCMDFDNHQGDATDNLARFLDIEEISNIYKQYNLPIESTQSGGYHLLFRTDTKISNKKLASRLFNDKPDCFIEVKAQDGYFISAPTKGYKVIRNSILNIARLNAVEIATMIDMALSMNEFFKTMVVTEYEGDERAGDKFNKEATIGDMSAILSSAGWQDIGNRKWRRPSKTSGISGSLDNINGCYIFYCFTSNGYPLEEGRGYSPFQLKTMLQYDGDYSRCAKSLPAPNNNKVTITTNGIPEYELEKLLQSCHIDTRKVVERPPVVVSIVQKNGSSYEHRRLFTLGNFSVIIGKAKSKKTYLLSLIVSCLLKKNDMADKFIASLTEDKNMVVWFDTEQGEYDSYNVIKRIERLSGTQGLIKAYNLRPYSPTERCQIIEYAFKTFGDKMAFCVIDGIADLSNAINDELEASRVSTMILRLTKEHNCHLSIVIHQNKNDNFATGHLGSSLMKKAEIIISTNKVNHCPDAEIRCDMSRGVDFDPFYMSIDADGFPYVGDKPVIKVDDNEAESLLDRAERKLEENFFNDKGELVF